MRENAKQEMPVEDQFYDYPDRPVPADKRRTQLNIAVVTTGMAVAMSTLYTGSADAATVGAPGRPVKGQGASVGNEPGGCGGERIETVSLRKGLPTAELPT